MRIQSILANHSRKFSCIIIGGGPLLQPCAELLRDRGHQVIAVFSATSDIQSWCVENNVALFYSLEEKLSRNFLLTNQFDYLFSLNNNWIIKPWLLKQPRKLAINYHNALLPTYGGVHATCWAIYNEEEKHGVTLHIITSSVDEGDILLQRSIVIEKSDTALSLNMKCQEVFLNHLFFELIDGIEKDALHPVVQNITDASRKSFHYLKDKIDPLINWGNSAFCIEKMCRALSMGSSFNKIGIPHFIFDNKVFFPRNVFQCDNGRTISNATPGEILEITKTGLVISTQQGVLIISEIIDAAGRVYRPDEFSERYSMKAGAVLPIPDQKVAQSLLFYRSKYYQDEFFWETQLRHIHPQLTLPFQDLKNNKNSVNLINRYTIFCVENSNESRIFLASVLLLYLARINQINDASIAFFVANEYSDQSCTLSEIVPFSFSIDFSKSYSECSEKLSKHLELTIEKKSYFVDLLHRINGLNLESLNFSVIIDYSGKARVSEAHPYCFSISNSGIYLDYYIGSASLTFVESLSSFASSFQFFVLCLKENPACALNSLPLVSLEEHNRLLMQLPQEGKCVYADQETMTIHCLFEQQVLRTPLAIAMEFENKSMSYNELHHASNNLASVLVRYRPSATAEFLVPICIDRGFEMIIGILSILKAGGAYVPIDPDYPKERIDQILDDTQAVVVLTHKTVTFNTRCSVIYLDYKEIRNSYDSFMTADVVPHDLAYVIYTSGTTGRPKGVMMEHYSLVNRLYWMKNRYPMTVGARFLHKTPFVFDWSFAEIFLPLISGACLVIATPGGHRDAAYLQQLLLRNSIHYIHFVPSMFVAFVDYINSTNKHYFVNLKYLFLSGENVTVTMVKRAREIFSGKIENLYGPTEGGEVSYDDCDNILNTNIPIGYPISNSELHVLNDCKKPLPLGTIGKLYIGGTVLARGYWNNIEKTKERFIANPFFDQYLRTSKILYDTGDLARRLPSGAIDFLGRMDDQVKIRGMRVELGEIEAVLREYEAVMHAIVNLLHDGLVAYLILKKSHTLDLNAIKNFLSARLPVYMIPNAFVLIEKLPLTHNGKVDRKALPVPFKSDFFDKDSYSAPETTLQKELIILWKSIIGKSLKNIENIGIRDSFYDIGGNSISTTYLFAKINARYNFQITLRDFINNPTISYISSAISGLYQVKNMSNSFSDYFNQDLKIDCESVKFCEKNIFPEFNSILLTGAAGFLGASLLYQLLFKTSGDIYCLVRGDSIFDARDRLNKNFIKYYPCDPIKNNRRVKVILGNLEDKNLGMSTQDLGFLLSKIDVIYHNAAYVHHIHAYDTLRCANVLSTAQLFTTFVNEGNVKAFYYISTLSAAKKNIFGVATEDWIAATDQPTEQMSGYVQTKWMSEHILSLARVKGVPITIFRPGWITGKRETGIFSIENDHLGRLIKSCIQMKAAPDFDISLSVVPVDFISQLIVDISLDSAQQGKIFNLSNQHLITWENLINWIQNYGYEVQKMSYNEWFALLNQSDESNALFALLPLYHPNSVSVRAMDQRLFFSQDNNTSHFLRSNNLEYPVIDDLLLKKYFEYFHQCGFIDRPKNNQKIQLQTRQATPFMLFSASM